MKKEGFFEKYNSCEDNKYKYTKAEDLKNPQAFKEILLYVRDNTDYLKGKSLKEVDQILWAVGKDLFDDKKRR